WLGRSARRGHGRRRPHARELDLLGDLSRRLRLHSVARPLAQRAGGRRASPRGRRPPAAPCRGRSAARAHGRRAPRPRCRGRPGEGGGDPPSRPAVGAPAWGNPGRAPPQVSLDGSLCDRVVTFLGGASVGGYDWPEEAPLNAAEEHLEDLWKENQEAYRSLE